MKKNKLPIEKRTPYIGDIIIGDTDCIYLVLGYDEQSYCHVHRLGAILADFTTDTIIYEYLNNLIKDIISRPLSYDYLARIKVIEGELDNLFEYYFVLSKFSFDDKTKLKNWYTKSRLMVKNLPALRDLDDSEFYTMKSDRFLNFKSYIDKIRQSNLFEFFKSWILVLLVIFSGMLILGLIAYCLS
jgi:hypothetical protein